MPTRGRFKKGRIAFAGRARALFANQSFPPAALAALKKGKFFNREALEMLTMCNPDFLKSALKELGERKISPGTFEKMARENTYFESLSPNEKDILQRCHWKDFVRNIKDIREVKKIRLTMFERLVLQRVGKHLEGRSVKIGTTRHISRLFSVLRAQEAKYFTFRQVLTPQETKELWRRIKDSESQILDTIIQMP
ncbi:MAG: hypothetical protein HY392_00360 [Candidatus Diapherotrites archaeon]|nr:hypothetical protein [Candidatus Diapherotrites archaeon]